MSLLLAKEKLDFYYQKYNDSSFIESDPISIPHRFNRLQDIEISGFWVAMLSWGQRKTIINKANELLDLMDNSPFEFIMGHEEIDLKRFEQFKHRTFNATDTLYFIHFFKNFYTHHDSLEEAFIPANNASNTYSALAHFHELFFQDPLAPHRTKKHVSTPLRKSACKRLNMFLRWMVRQDDKGVDFGLWKKLSPAQLMIPLDVHVFNVATQFGLLKRTKADWQAVEELTSVLRQFDPADPVKYDYALFGLGVLQKNDLP